MAQAKDHGATEAMLTGILHGAQFRNGCLEILQHLPSAVIAAIIHHHNFVRHLIQFELKIEMLNHCRQ